MALNGLSQLGSGLQGFGDRADRLRQVRGRISPPVLGGDGNLGNDRRPPIQPPYTPQPKAPPVVPNTQFSFGSGVNQALGTVGRFTRNKTAADFLMELLQTNSIDPAFQRLFGDQTQFGMGELNTMLRQPGLVTNPLYRQFLNTLGGVHNPAKFMPDVGITPYAQANLSPEILARLGLAPQVTQAPPPESGQPTPRGNDPLPPKPAANPDDEFNALISQMSGPIVESGARATAQRQRRQEILQQLLALGDPRLLGGLSAYL